MEPFGPNGMHLRARETRSSYYPLAVLSYTWAWMDKRVPGGETMDYASLECPIKTIM